jgi:hypothetical protein
MEITRPFQRSFSDEAVRTIGIVAAPDTRVSAAKFSEIVARLSVADNRIELMEPWPRSAFDQIEKFYRSRCVIGYSSDFVYYLSFMRPGSVAIIVQLKFA